MNASSNFQELLAQVVFFHRKKAGLSRELLCSLAGISRGALVALEKNTGNPKLTSILAVCEVLNIEVKLISPLMEQFDAQS